MGVNTWSASHPPSMEGTPAVQKYARYSIYVVLLTAFIILRSKVTRVRPAREDRVNESRNGPRRIMPLRCQNVRMCCATNNHREETIDCVCSSADSSQEHRCRREFVSHVDRSTVQQLPSFPQRGPYPIMPCSKMRGPASVSQRLVMRDTSNYSPVCRLRGRGRGTGRGDEFEP